MSRRSKLTPQRIAGILDAIEHGATIAGAAERAQLSPTCVDQWLAKGRAARSGKYFDFAQAFAQAQARSEDKVVRTAYRGVTQPSREIRTRTFASGEVETLEIQRDPDPRAGLQYLERLWPNKYGRRVGIHGVADQPAVGVAVDDGALTKLRSLTPTQLAVIAAVDAELAGEEEESDADAGDTEGS